MLLEVQDGESRKKNRKAKNIVGKIRNKTDLARMKEYSSKVWFGTIKKTCIKKLFDVPSVSFSFFDF